MNRSPHASLDRLARLAAGALRSDWAAIRRCDGTLRWCVRGEDVPVSALEPVVERLAAELADLQPGMVRRAEEPSAGALAGAGIGAWAGTPVRGEDGLLLAVLCVGGPALRRWSEEDEQLLAELAATAAAELEGAGAVRPHEPAFRALVEQSQQVFFYVHDADHRFTYVSPAVQAVLGYAPDECLGRRYDELLVGDDSDARVAELTERALREGEAPVPYTAVIRHREGHSVVLELIEGPLLRDGQVVGVHGIARDVTERLRAEEALRTSEQRYRTVFEQSADAIFMSAPDGRLLEVNPSFLELFALDRAAVPRINVADGYIDPEARVRLMAELEREGSVRDREVRFRRRDGSRLTCRLSATALRGPDGQVVGYHGIIRDVTEQQRAERALRLAMEQHEAILNNTPDLAWLKDADGRFLSVNDALARACGMAREEIVGKTDHEVFPYPLAEKYRADDRRVLEEGRRLVVEEVIRLGDGTLATIETIKTPFRDASGAFAGTAGIARNVTERQRAEQERIRLLERERQARAEAEAAEERARFVAEASERFAASLDTAATLHSLVELTVPRFGDACVVFLLEEDGRVRRLFPTHVDPEREELLRSHLRERGSDLDSVVPPVARVLSTGRPELLNDLTPDQLRSVAGEQKDAIMAALGVRGVMIVPLVARGRILGAVGYGASGTRRWGQEDLALAEEVARRAALAFDHALLFDRVQQAVRDREQVLRVVSHDLRNPLATVLLSATSILETPRLHEGLDPGVREMVQSMALSAEQATRLIQDLVDMAHIDAGRLSIEPRRHPLAALLQSVVSVLQPLAVARGVQLVSEAPDEPTWARLDAQRILQVFSNLVGNAIRYTPSGGRITLRAQASGSEVRFSVSDTGSGIRPEHLPQLFERLWRVEHGAHGGAGLGLTIARGIVEAHGGRIWAESRMGEGSTFHFTVPQGEPGDAVAVRGEEVVVRGMGRTRSARVLVVDDDPRIREALRRVLHQAGLEVLEAAHGAQGIELAHTARPDVALMDLSMPVVDGWEAARRLRSEFPRLPVVAVTGQALGELEREAIHQLFDAYLAKPTDARTVLDCICELLQWERTNGAA